MLYKTLPLIILVFVLSELNAQGITVNNSFSPARKSGYYNWTVYVQGSEAVLNSINHVEYLLHPTFPKPQVSSYERRSSFSYTSNGWGEFEIRVKVVFKNASATPQYINYWLRLKPRVVKGAAVKVR